MSPGFSLIRLFAAVRVASNRPAPPGASSPKASAAAAAELVRRRPNNSSGRRRHKSYPDHHRRQQQDHHQHQHQHQHQQQQQEQQEQAAPQRQPHDHQQQQEQHNDRHHQQMINGNQNNNNNTNNNSNNNNQEQPTQQQTPAAPVVDSRDAKETAEDTAILKRFKIVQLIGTGNYARVYRGFSQSGRELAIKSINLSKTTDNYKYRFLPRELTILKRISHANICKIYEIMQVADRVFIIMQFCSRGTIADLLHRRGPLSEPMTRFLFVPTVEAVNYLHSIDCAHRDLKVENILLDHEFTPKLTDFSYSCIMSSSSSYIEKSHKTMATTQSPTNTLFNQTGTVISNRHKTVSGKPGCSLHVGQTQSPSRGIQGAKLNETFCGTLPYLSPEMVRQLPYDPKKTDVWSLGVCLFIMLNDRAPFLFDDIKSMVKKQIAKDYKFRANVEFSSEIKELVGMMLEPEYNRRITANEVLQHSWTFGPREKPNLHSPTPIHNNSLI